MPQHSSRGARAKSCDVQNGLPVVDGQGCGYYVCRDDGRRMLVMERRSGERLRINGAMELVVLEIHPGKVKFAIEYSPGDDTKPSIT